MADDAAARDGCILLMPGEGKPLSFAGISTVIKATGADTRGAWSLIESTVLPHFDGFKPHRHRKMTEAFYILDGILTMQLDDRRIRATPGSFVVIPPGMVHTYSNEEAAPARYLLFMSPGGFDQYLVKLAEMIRSEAVWPPADRAGLNALAEEYDASPE